MSDHMKGWEAYGISGDDADPDVRRIGTYGRGGADGGTPGTEPFPDAELTGGIAHVFIHLSGDDTSEAFVKVVGSRKAAVAQCWKRTADAIHHLTGEVWP